MAADPLGMDSPDRMLYPDAWDDDILNFISTVELDISTTTIGNGEPWNFHRSGPWASIEGRRKEVFKRPLLLFHELIADWRRLLTLTDAHPYGCGTN